MPASGRDIIQGEGVSESECCTSKRNDSPPSASPSPVSWMALRLALSQKFVDSEFCLFIYSILKKSRSLLQLRFFKWKS
jgi:hypothetical protein